MGQKLTERINLIVISHERKSLQFPQEVLKPGRLTRQLDEPFGKLWRLP